MSFNGVWLTVGNILKESIYGQHGIASQKSTMLMFTQTPKYSNLNIHCHENLKCYFISVYSLVSAF